MRLFNVCILLQWCFYPIVYSYLGILFVPIYMIQRAIEAINRVKDQNELENLLSRQRMSRQTRAAKEDGKIDILKDKCFDKIPNCKRELCQHHHNSFWKNCKKTCGYCKHLKQVHFWTKPQ